MRHGFGLLFSLLLAIALTSAVAAQSTQQPSPHDKQLDPSDRDADALPRGRFQGRGGAGRGGPGRGFGFGPRFGRGPAGENGNHPGAGAAGRGPAGHAGAARHAHDERHDADRDVFHFLLTNHDKIVRTVKQLPGGVETLTESEDPEIADKIKEHVEWMKDRVENTNPIRMRDPLFAELFQHTDKIKMIVKETEQGVRVTETSADPYVARLIKAHAEVVSGFVARGFSEAMKNHAAPKPGTKPNLSKIYPTIASHGGVVRLPDAAAQPRPDSRFLVDVTSGSDPAELNPAIEKVAKYLNIYAGAGAEPAKAKIAMVFHGEATLTVLNDDAYGKRFGTEQNPNLHLLRQFHEAGVEMYVCGQSLISEGAAMGDVVIFVEPAVSALTAVVNLQSDGYSYLPLR